MSKGSKVFWAFVTGAAAGALLGILYAPDKGKNTRDKLSFQLEKYKEKLQEIITQLMDEKDAPSTAAKAEGQKVVNEARYKAEQLLGDVESLIEQIKGKTPLS
ncbi:MAG: YtxH domain-containing protein [Cytophagaceae bacterium]